MVATPLYKPYKYVLPKRVGFFRHLDLKTGIDVPHFRLELVIAFEGTTTVYERICGLNSK